MIVAVLCAVAFAAGLMDAIAGGGGLLTVPALMLAIPDARLALGTNKGQAVFGSAASLASFARAGRIERSRALPSFIAASAGAVIGVELVLALRPQVIRPVVLVLLFGVALLFAFRWRKRPPAAAPGEPNAPRGWAIARAHPIVAAVGVGLLMGAYDGFFGPGTGTFLIALGVAVFGDDLTHATANAKVCNFASNLTSFALFAAAGRIDLRLALPMAGAQAVGGWLGARAALRGGERLVRGGVLLVTTALIARLAWQIATGQ